MMKKALHTISLLIFMCVCACGSDSHTSGQKDEAETIPVPSGVTLKEANSDSLAFAWSAVENALTYSYKLLKGMTLVKSGSTAENNVLLSELEPATEYKFAVRAENSKVSSAYSDYISAKTTEGKTPGGGGGENPGKLDDVYAAMKIPSAEEDGIARAFPGAEGGGMYTSGGRGGTVYHVTNLDDSGEGSLRYGIEKAQRPCTIVFDVAGTITLKSTLSISKGNLTIAGQTAPGDGICIKGRYTQIKADNVIIRFVRFRLGDGDPKASDSDDCIWGRYLSNIIIDHCSMSWSIDECASFYSNSNFTMQWCYIAESMRSCTLHSKGNHGYGGIWGGENASFHHNALVHHDSRNPRFDHPHIYENHKSPSQRGTVDFRNNVIYDWGSNNSYGGEGYGAGKGTGINMVANYYKPGQSSSDRKYFMNSYAVYSSCSSCGKNVEDGYPLLYITGNTHSKYPDISSDNTDGISWHDGEGHANYKVTSEKQFTLAGPDGESIYTTTHSASAAMENVCAYGGASLSRDKVDSRISSDIKNGTGCIIDCVTAQSGKTSVETLYGITWPPLSATEEQISRASTDSDSDGIPDWYEYLFGLNPSDSSDATAKTIDKYGRYTNLEMYLHYLVRDTVAGQETGGAYNKI